MDETTTTTIVTKTPLTRKAIILIGAASGLIIAGTLSLFRNDEPQELMVIEETSSDD